MLALLSRTTIALLVVVSISHTSTAQSTVKFIPPEAAVAVSCIPIQAIKHEALGDVPWNLLKDTWRDNLGFPLDNASSILVFAAPPGPDGMPLLGAVVELREPVPIEQVAPRLQVLKFLELDESRQKLIGPTIGSVTWEVRAFKENTLLIGLSPTVDLMQKQSANPVEGELVRRLSAQPDVAFQACLVMQPIRRLAKPILSDPRLAKIVPGIDEVPDQLSAATFQLDLSDSVPHMKLDLEAVNPVAAEQLQAFAPKTAKLGLDSLSGAADSSLQQFVDAFTKIKPKRERSNVTFSTADGDAVTRAMYVRGLTDLVTFGAESTMFQTRRVAAVQDLERLTYALHMFADKNQKHFVPQASKSPGGKPLLSWRVLLLPYLDQQDLYDQFHLDEPWNSPHNLSLVKKMPDVFTVPGDETLAAEGKTRYQLPIGPSLPSEQIGSLYFSDITDGSSNTLFAVEAPQDRAVIWTQPVDLPVDPGNPRATLLPEKSLGFAASRYDGSASFYTPSTSTRKLQVLLTHQGGEINVQE